MSTATLCDPSAWQTETLTSHSVPHLAIEVASAGNRRIALSLNLKRIACLVFDVFVCVGCRGPTPAIGQGPLAPQVVERSCVRATGAAATEAGSPGSGVKARVYPARPLIERDEHQQLLNFEFALENTGATARSLERIEMSAFDPCGRLVRRQFIWVAGALSPGLMTIPERTLPPNGSLGVFNPFFALPPELPVHRLRYQFIFSLEGIQPVDSTSIDVVPATYRQPVRLTLPVDGPAIIDDGHDFYSHHRRIPLGSESLRKAGINANPVRYANDFVPVGPNGELARGSLARPESWYAYGAVVRAPGDGEVVSVAHDVPENRIEDGELVMADDRAADAKRQALGNHVIIKHRDDLYSVLAHLKDGIAQVRVGQQVRAGEVVGKIGFSGDTGLHVHLHHMLVNAPDFNAESLPAYFDRVRFVALPKQGEEGPVRDRVRLDTGDLFELAKE